MHHRRSMTRVIVHTSIAALAVVVCGSLVASAGEPVTPWWRFYDGPVSGDDETSRVATSPDGSMVFTGGRSKGEHGFDYIVLATEADGTAGWTFRYDGTGEARDQAIGLAVAPDGSAVYVTGLSAGDGTKWDAVTIAIDASTGDPIWVKRFDGAAHLDDLGNDVILSPDGNRVFVTGCTVTARDACVALTVAYVAETGQRVWTSRANGSGDGVDSMYDATLSANGAKVFTTGIANDVAGTAMAVIAYKAADGAEIWSRHYRGGTSGDYGAGFALTAIEQGLVHVTGTVRTGTKTEDDVATVALDAGTGVVVWAKRYNQQEAYDDVGWDIVGDAATDTVFATGTGRDGFPLGSDWVTLAYDAVTGQRRWVMLHDGDLFADQARGVALLPDGAGVVVTGYVRYITPVCATIVYDPETGDELWDEEFLNVTFNNYCLDVATGTPEGRIYLAGTNVGDETGLDALTLAYDVALGPTATSTGPPATISGPARVPEQAGTRTRPSRLPPWLLEP